MTEYGDVVVGVFWVNACLFANIQPETYACLLDASLDVNHRFEGYFGSALVASKCANVAMTKMLLEEGADPNPNARWDGAP